MIKAEVSCNVQKFKWMLKCFAGGKGGGGRKVFFLSHSINWEIINVELICISTWSLPLFQDHSLRPVQYTTAVAPAASYSP
jgi:hypothetical protein